MILNLPYDVEKYILDFVIEGMTIEKLSIICKNWKIMIEKSYYKKIEKDLYNKTGILLEEERSNLNDSYLNLAKKWEKFHTYRWDFINKKYNENPEEKTILWKIGDYIDAKIE